LSIKIGTTYIITEGFGEFLELLGVSISQYTGPCKVVDPGC